MKIIDKFDGEFAFLSNFYESENQVCDRLCGFVSSVEHAYQAAKTNDAVQIMAVCNASTPGQAKKLGRKVDLVADWEEAKDSVMLDLLMQKFRKGTECAQKLENTGSATLIEGNWWGDTYWGKCKGVGKNKLGFMLMFIRELNRL